MARDWEDVETQTHACAWADILEFEGVRLVAMKTGNSSHFVVLL